jgi:hypothetical protein
MAFTDGTLVAAILDRNGLGLQICTRDDLLFWLRKPAFWNSAGEFLVRSSAAGSMLLIAQRWPDHFDKDIKEKIVREQPYARGWIPAITFRICRNRRNPCRRRKSWKS